MATPGEYDVFISYAKEDRDEIARPIAVGLRERGLRVWFDEFEVKAGQSLVETIGQGLASSRFGIVILSRNYVSKRWTLRELRGLFALEMGGRCVVLPVLHRMAPEDVLSVSPLLADSVSISSDLGMENLLAAIAEAVVGDSPIVERATRAAGGPPTASHAPDTGQAGPLMKFLCRLADMRREGPSGMVDMEVGRLAGILARLSELPGQFTEWISSAGSLRNIGYLLLPGHTLTKAGRLSEDEFEILKSHTTEGAKLLADLGDPVLDMAASIAAAHHEHWDGGGYPSSLRGDAIPLEARIVAVVDTFCALTRDRPYRSAMSAADAADVMQRTDGHWDPHLLGVFRRNLGCFVKA